MIKKKLNEYEKNQYGCQTIKKISYFFFSLRSLSFDLDLERDFSLFLSLCLLIFKYFSYKTEIISLQTQLKLLKLAIENAEHN